MNNVANCLYGAMIGDIAGSRFEWNATKHKTGYALFDSECCYTDDTAMTIAIARALMASGRDAERFESLAVQELRDVGRRFPHAGYGGSFRRWLKNPNPEPYNSWGNGSAMRVSSCGYAARTLDEALQLAEASARVTHNHPEGIKGAQATAAAIYLARTGADKDSIRDYVETTFEYDLHRTLNDIRPGYAFDVSCQGSVPESIICFLESDSYEDTLRNAISLGGDSDTMAAIGGSIAWAFYLGGKDLAEEPEADLASQADLFLPQEFIQTARQFDEFCLA
ncbi:ADP-ribosyl-[dinitrogen reductase] hydrolase [Slackia heliotrinireducens]|uniref:ADP-ribosylglycohydrolase n=1 Tax=Slackia heliotrinireducens (strain ATCC 29202 / DSM 20476 / NCTC 11029 / RHS 1) TaxID=471855 RepID=C7N1U5_SLAHD|nr:ADP-ribosylglycohydrolase family protein [Slackia heliotrinireducens]ACV23386.1 ADP-ribosylglycohydrolase [Slackia heliotrinireducens DSM 20476]VEH02662.1 ADP-ribosyl-[dinitrogen reductase] hydrolase [Slackia heliotrinireducens]